MFTQLLSCWHELALFLEKVSITMTQINANHSSSVSQFTHQWQTTFFWRQVIQIYTIEANVLACCKAVSSIFSNWHASTEKTLAITGFTSSITSNIYIGSTLYFRWQGRSVWTKLLWSHCLDFCSICLKSTLIQCSMWQKKREKKMVVSTCSPKDRINVKCNHVHEYFV